MTRMHEATPTRRPTAYLIGVQTPDLTEADTISGLDELARLVKTLGYDVVGRTWQKRPGTGSAMVLGEGKIESIARLTSGPGMKGIGPTLPNATNPKRKKAILRREEEARKAREEAEEDFDDEYEDEFDDDQEFSEDEVYAVSADEDEGSGDEGYGGEPPDAIIFDTELGPKQTRNLERAFGVTVMDRTGVIIEIFSRHARTRAARLQVEIARLKYLAPRIRETGGGEDRGGGGIGGRGAGETAVELDRRKIRDRIKELKGEFAAIENEHETRRARRLERTRTVALVGYTNAGKSSLMRAMTGSEVYVADKLFATLDTTVRPIVPETRPAILISDTVGFIKKLPHDLVASFKSTLDEAANASLLLFVVDSADPAFRSQLEVTKSVLGEVGAGEIPSFLILNKRDKVSAEEAAQLAQEFPDAIAISTRNKEDLSMLRDRLITFFEGEMVDEEIFIAYGVQGAIGEMRAEMKVLEESYGAQGVTFKVRATPERIARLRARFNLSGDDRY